MLRKTQTLDLVGPLTRDIDLVVAAIDKISRMAGLGGLKEGSRSQLRMESEMQVSSAMSRAGDQEEMAFRGEMETQEEKMLVRSGSQVLAGFFKGLADTPGRKALLWVNDRFLLDEDTRDDIAGLIAEAGASRIAVYPFAGDANALADPSGRGFNSDPAAATMRSELAGLDLIANETGGKVSQSLATIGDNLAVMRRDMNSFYSLGYLTPHGGDGRSHDIRVNVKRPGTSLRYQKSYVDKSPELRVIDTLFAALLIDGAADELGVRATIGEITPEKKKLFNVPIDLIIPLEPLALVEQDGNRVGRVSIYTMVVGGREQGEPTLLRQNVKVPVGVDIRGGAVAGERKLSLKKGEHMIALVIRDDLSGKKTGVRIPVDVGKDVRQQELAERKAQAGDSSPKNRCFRRMVSSRRGPVETSAISAPTKRSIRSM